MDGPTAEGLSGRSSAVGTDARYVTGTSELQFSVPDNLGQQHVMVVDDSVPIRRMMARCLRNAGMHVLTADNGRRP